MGENSLSPVAASAPLVYVVIPNRNGREHLSYSLRSLFDSKYENFKVVLVDNGSTDDSLDYVAREFGDVAILKNTGKRGFAAAVNVGIRHALIKKAEYIAVFSNDIKVLPSWLTLALPAFGKAENTGLVGFTEIPREREDLFYRCLVDSPILQCKQVKRLAGCLYICSAEVFSNIGLFDEDYFMYGEDNDFFHRLGAGGFRLLETNIPVWHFGEGSAKNSEFQYTWLAYRNALRFSIKNESLYGVARMILGLVNQGCSPFVRRSKGDPVFRRMRRYNPLINGGLIIMSGLWNLWHLSETRRARHRKCPRLVY